MQRELSRGCWLRQVILCWVILQEDLWTYGRVEHLLKRV